MAELTDPAADLKVPEDATAQAQNSGKGRKTFLIIVAASILFPALGGAVVVYGQYERLASMAVSVGGGVGTEDAEEEESTQITYGEFKQLDGLIINPAGSGGKRFLLIGLGLESAQPEALEEVGSREIVIRDAVLSALGGRSVEELSDIGLRDQVKEQVREAINGILLQGQIDRLYFTQYVLQ